MKHDIPAESVDLIYLDPPFFTGAVQKGKDKWNPGAMEISYNDTKDYWGKHFEEMRKNAPAWLNSIPREDEFKSYIYYMRQRLQLCHRVLKQTGSIYLHCDWRASHYLKMVMDEVFGFNNFRNEIIWHYGLGAGRSSRGFLSKHDIIFFYSKSSAPTLNILRGDITNAMKNKYCHSDSNGKYMMSYDKKYYLKGGKQIDDVWDIPNISSTDKVRTGYPTQKPPLLLKRIIEASSNEGDVVLDPFCGCGTTIIAANALGRQWIGIDISKDALDITAGSETQMTLEQIASFKGTVRIERDLEEIKKLNPHEFERWVNEFYKATKPNPDRGVDGITPQGIPIQTKSFEVKYDVVDKLVSAFSVHPSVNKSIKELIVVSQVGFDDSARKAKYQYETEKSIRITLTTPAEMMTGEVKQ
jgi:site-specific DNA-methyltransferase (adenine-specific)